jgi:ABC-2 type transport system ATP-binding protein
MKMKFALSLALAHHADFLILDEPTSGLDPIFRRELLARLQTLIQDEKKSVLFSTHITTDLERIADYITFIHNGKVVLSSAKDDLLENWAVVKGGNELLREKEPLFRGVRKMEFGFEALTDDVSAARRRWGEKILTEKATLEDIIFFTTRRNSLV